MIHIELKCPNCLREIVAGCRSVLEVSLNELEAAGNNINLKIKDLYNKNVITKVLYDWANHIRLEGNKAIHEIETDKNKAREIIEFIKIFLEYTFVLPHRIEALK